jgi:RNA polymerase sigma-70 factor (ECF subfamily)
MSSDASTKRVLDQVDEIYRSEARRIFATLIRLLGDFDLAENALQDAFRVATEQWPQDGIPDNPRAWLVSTGRFKAIDGLRRRARIDSSLDEKAGRLVRKAAEPVEQDGEQSEDDRLKLIFTCCHPALAPDARVALTLREACGLTTEAIAQALLSSPPTLGQRIARAKAKIREEGIPYQVPSREELPERVDAVLQVIHLIFNEGYFAASSEAPGRPDLSGEAIRLGRLLVELLPEPEVVGLLALMLLTEARRPARIAPSGSPILLEEQDRSLWDPAQIAEGTALVERALATRKVGPYTIQATIAAVHAAARTVATTNWTQIVGLYDRLLRSAPSPVFEINRASALAMRDGPERGLIEIEAIMARGDLAGYSLAHSARAEIFRQMGRMEDARRSYERALELAQHGPERRFLRDRLGHLPY